MELFFGGQSKTDRESDAGRNVKSGQKILRGLDDVEIQNKSSVSFDSPSSNRMKIERALQKLHEMKVKNPTPENMANANPLLASHIANTSTPVTSSTSYALGPGPPLQYQSAGLSFQPSIQHRAAASIDTVNRTNRIDRATSSRPAISEHLTQFLESKPATRNFRTADA